MIWCLSTTVDIVVKWLNVTHLSFFIFFRCCFRKLIRYMLITGERKLPHKKKRKRKQKYYKADGNKKKAIVKRWQKSKTRYETRKRCRGGLTGLCEQALWSGCPCSVFLLLLLNVLTEHVCKFNVTNSGQWAPICFRASSSSCGKDKHWERKLTSQ